MTGPAKLYRTYLHIKICLIFELQFAESFKAILVKSLYHDSKSLDSFNEEKTAYRTWISYREQETKLTNF